jgi:hypothetical protein
MQEHTAKPGKASRDRRFEPAGIEPWVDLSNAPGDARGLIVHAVASYRAIRRITTKETDESAYKQKSMSELEITQIREGLSLIVAQRLFFRIVLFSILSMSMCITGNTKEKMKKGSRSMGNKQSNGNFWPLWLQLRSLCLVHQQRTLTIGDRQKPITFPVYDPTALNIYTVMLEIGLTLKHLTICFLAPPPKV